MEAPEIQPGKTKDHGGIQTKQKTQPADFGETLFCLKDLKKKDSGVIWGEVFLRSVQLYPFIFRRVFVSPVPRLEVHQPMVHNQEHPNPISPLRLHFAPFACWKPNPNHRKVKGKVKVGGPVVVSFQLLMPCSRNLEVSVSGVNEGWKVEKIL